MKHILAVQENSELRTVLRRIHMREGRDGLVTIRRNNHRHHGYPVATVWHIMRGRWRSNTRTTDKAACSSGMGESS